jgi:hypothetical protein
MVQIRSLVSWALAGRIEPDLAWPVMMLPTAAVLVSHQSHLPSLTDVSRGHYPSRGLAMLTTALGPSIVAMLDAPDTRRPPISCSMDSSLARRTSMASADPFWISACG